MIFVRLNGVLRPSFARRATLYRDARIDFERGAAAAR